MEKAQHDPGFLKASQKGKLRHVRHLPPLTTLQQLMPLAKLAIFSPIIIFKNTPTKTS